MIRLINITKEYKIDNEITFFALKNINLKINSGEFTTITGPSGSGKSTLMHIIGLLDQPSSGKILIEKKDISKLDDDQLSSLRNQYVGFVFQQFNLINKLTVLENIVLPAIYSRKKLDFDPKIKGTELIKKFGLSEKTNSYPNKLSGGQQQRVAILRALIMSPKLILADEPTGNLDSKNGLEIMELLRQLNEKEKMTIIVVTHEADIASYAKRVIKIRDGKIVKK